MSNSSALPVDHLSEHKGTQTDMEKISEQEVGEIGNVRERGGRTAIFRLAKHS